MANLRSFIWSGSRDGMPVDIYLNRTPRIGHGTVQVAEPLRVVIQADVTVLGNRVAGSVEIVMADESDRGACTVITNGSRKEGCPYHVDGTYLKIQVADREITLGGAGDKQWTWLGISGVPGWIGIWPAAQALLGDQAEREVMALPG